MEHLIICQRDIPRQQWRYGLRASAATGCGWIATYNALRLMGYPAEPEALIRYYERQVPVVHGTFGTLAPAPAGYFKKQGFPVTMTARRQDFDRVAKESRVCILFYHWRKGWRLGAHFVALEYRDGCFVGYNTYRNSKGPDRYGPSLEEFLRRRGYFGCLLTGIRDPA